VSLVPPVGQPFSLLPPASFAVCDIRYILLTAVGLTPGGSSTVQYTVAHKQYTEQHNETEYTEQNIHNNKST